MADEGIQLIDRALLDRVLEAARRSPRGRLNHNFHHTPAEDPNRFLNAMLAGTYVAPHRHLTVPKPEMFVALAGRVSLFTFDDTGRIAGRFLIGEGAPGGRIGIDIAAGIWHTLVVLSPAAILLEVKPGGYDAATDKQFAPWAPREGDPGAPEYLARLEAEAREAWEA